MLVPYRGVLGNRVAIDRDLLSVASWNAQRTLTKNAQSFHDNSIQVRHAQFVRKAAFPFTYDLIDFLLYTFLDVWIMQEKKETTKQRASCCQIRWKKGFMQLLFEALDVQNITTMIVCKLKNTKRDNVKQTI